MPLPKTFKNQFDSLGIVSMECLPRYQVAKCLYICSTSNQSELC